MVRRISASMFFLSILFLAACSGGGGGSSGSSTSGNSSGGQVSVSNSLTVQSSTGATAYFPQGSVPPSAGAISPTIEVDRSKNLQLPTGVNAVGDVYQLGPSGVNFQTGVAITLPVTASSVAENVVIYRFEQDGSFTNLGGNYDPAAKTVTANTNRFSWVRAVTPPYMDGCVLLDNSQAPPYSWKNVSVSQIISLTHPEVLPAGWSPGGAQVSPDPCISGFCNQINWVLPQGSYQVCVEEWRADSLLESATFRGSKIITTPVVVSEPWTPSTPCNSAGGGLNVSGISSALPGVVLSPYGCPGSGHAGLGMPNGTNVYSGSFVTNGLFTQPGCSLYLTFSGTVTQTLNISGGSYTGSVDISMMAYYTEVSCQGLAPGSAPFTETIQISGTLPNVGWTDGQYFTFTGSLAGNTVSGNLVLTDIQNPSDVGSASAPVSLTQ